ncbi:hypothetical protein [Pseudonocardia sp. TRM90224]|uniref:hypothetical protein n=1 Tax=Pseudonocardia sp. TRM90224 TaxID=2812678 RepID=UPI001E598DA9|nr:hypothetical protein [Pseudonocardia sp. TRM90224]
MTDPRVISAAEEQFEQLLADTSAGGSHRTVMRTVKGAVVLAVLARTGPLVRTAVEATTRLEALQAASGLFTGGDNVASPPDSAFTLNDVAITLALLERRPTSWSDDLAERLRAILRAASPALLAGGVHTPNHRWELAAALAWSGTLLADATLLERAALWLAEGVDVDADGLYSERSPNYAAHVSNPSLTVLADLLDRPDLHDVVHRNLHAHLDLTDSAGTVETVHSRRQDQHAGFPLGPFLGQLTRAAARHSCSRCAEGAGRAITSPGIDAIDVLAQELLEPGLTAPPPDPFPMPAPMSTPPGRRLFGEARLLRERRGRAEITVYAGSDVPEAGRIGSGLAANPTFLRLRCGAVSIDSVRLSRDFFGLGPFRATAMTVTGDQVVLRERIAAAYYQPVAPSERRPDGRYPLEHEGRFSASMGFSRRRRDVSALVTAVEVDLHDDGVDLTVTTAGPTTAHSLELGLAPGTELTGAIPVGDERYELVAGHARVACAGDTLRIGPGLGCGPDRPPIYRPGEAYTHMNGTDAAGGTRLYLTWHSPGSIRISLRSAHPGDDRAP